MSMVRNDDNHGGIYKKVSNKARLVTYLTEAFSPLGLFRQQLSGDLQDRKYNYLNRALIVKNLADFHSQWLNIVIAELDKGNHGFFNTYQELSQDKYLKEFIYFVDDIIADNEFIANLPEDYK